MARVLVMVLTSTVLESRAAGARFRDWMCGKGVTFPLWISARERGICAPPLAVFV
jgi:hypothetical protein